MSKTAYSVIEYTDPSDNKWKTANLYEKVGDGISYRLAQLIMGGGEALGALFGGEVFDIAYDDEGAEIDELIGPLERIGDLVGDCVSARIPSDASEEATNYYEKFGSSPLADLNARTYYPPCVTYTLQDLDFLELLAKITSPKATRFFNRYFAKIQWLLYSVMQSLYITKRADVRVHIWGNL